MQWKKRWLYYYSEILVKIPLHIINVNDVDVPLIMSTDRLIIRSSDENQHLGVGVFIVAFSTKSTVVVYYIFLLLKFSIPKWCKNVNM